MLEFIEWLAWGFNGTRLGKKLWRLHDKVRERRLRRNGIWSRR